MRDLYAPFMSWGPSCSFPNCAISVVVVMYYARGGDNTPQRNPSNMVTLKVGYSANWGGAIRSLVCSQ